MQPTVIYIVSVCILMVSSMVYSYGALLSCFDDGFTLINNFTLAANILYVIGYLFDMIGETIKLEQKKIQAIRRSQYIIIDPEPNTRPISSVVFSRLSSITFILSAGVYTVIAVETCITTGWTLINITTLTGNGLYTIGCLIVTVTDFMRKDSKQNSLMNRMTLPLLQHLEF